MWKMLRRVLLDLEMIEVFGFPTLLVLIIDVEPQLLLCYHVDDLIMAYTDRVAPVVQKMKEAMTFGTEEEFEFRWCGR